MLTVSSDTKQKLDELTLQKYKDNWGIEIKWELLFVIGINILNPSVCVSVECCILLRPPLLGGYVGKLLFVLLFIYTFITKA